MFYQVGPIDHCAHVLVPVSQYIAENGYNAAWASGMSPSHLRMLNNDLLKNYIDVVP